MRWLTCTLGVVLLANQTLASEGDATEDPARVKAYLAKTYPEKKWQVGPTRLDTPEIQQVFPGQRFYFVRSSPPLPPGAPLPDLIKAWEEKMADYRKTALNATLRIDAEGNIAVISKATDLNAGMKKVTNEKEAQAAAAAACTLDPAGTPGLAKVKAEHVQVERRGEFWTAIVNVPNVMRGGVTFDREGKINTLAVKATPRFPPAVPPSAPPGLPPRKR
jgi:hypothetical protein